MMTDRDTRERLDRCLAMWTLSQPKHLATTPSSRVYRVSASGEWAILRLIAPPGDETEISGAAALRWWGGRGAVRLLNTDSHAQLLEYAPGEDLIGMVTRGDDDQATGIIADALNQLHAVKGAPFPDGLISLRVWFRDLFTKAEADSVSGTKSIYVRAAALADSLLATPRDAVVLHGDIHHGNIRRHPTRGWLAFDPNGLIGERTFDAANTLCNPMDMPELVEDEARLLRQAGILSDKLGIDLPRVLAYLFAYACLSASWFLSDGQDPGPTLRVAEMAESCLKGA